ncbi:hypothetical protein [Borrelia sp. A-FGy1]|nr:hypothetical protein [Borrelia sp. A-FGy1]
MSYPGFEDWWFDQAKKFFAGNKVGVEVGKMVAAIDKLCNIYKFVSILAL